MFHFLLSWRAWGEQAARCRDPEGKQDRAAAAMGSTANSDYSSFLFLFKNTVLTLRDRGQRYGEGTEQSPPAEGWAWVCLSSTVPGVDPAEGWHHGALMLPCSSLECSHTIFTGPKLSPCQWSLPRDSSSSSLTSPPLPVSHKLFWSVSAALIPLHKTNEHRGVSLIKIRKSVMW